MNNKTFIYAVLFIVFLFGLIVSIFSFCYGFHNVDLGQNMRFLNAEFDLELRDFNSKGFIWTATDSLVKGYQMQNVGFILGLASMFCLGLCLQYFVSERRFKK